MAQEHIDEFKKVVKMEFNRRKKTEEGLKLSHVYNSMSKAAGFRNWNTYLAVLEKM